MKASERAINLTRVFNLKEAFTDKDDWLPRRFFKPETSGALSETAADPKKFQEAKITYYNVMGWDDKGVPAPANLDDLDIAWAREWLS